MEQIRDNRILLSQITAPAFLTENGIITAVNEAAEKMYLQIGQPVEPMLLTGAEEYRAFSQGQLMVTLLHQEQELSASITRWDRGELICLEAQSDALRSLELAAMNLRRPLSDLLTLSRQLDNSDLTAQITHRLYQLDRIVCNMSDTAHPGTGRMEVRNLTSFLQEIFDKAGTPLPLEFTNLPQHEFCTFDSDLLERAIYNIIANAAKFAIPGSTIRANAAKHGNRMLLTVCNPVEPAQMLPGADFFDRYLRQPGLEDPRSGIGLGMTIIRAAAKAHRGTVLVETGEPGVMKLTLAMAMQRGGAPILRQTLLRPDYAGELDHCLLELADVLPDSCYLQDDH